MLAVMLLLRLNMSTSSKLQIILAFCFRLPLMILSGIHLLFSQHYIESREPQFTVTNEVMLQQALLIWSLVSATIPNMKPFVESLGMNMGLRRKTNAHHRTLAADNVFALQTIGSIPAPRTERHSVYPFSHEFPPDWESDQPHIETVVIGGSRSNTRSGDDENRGSFNGSEEMIIRKDVRWEISEELRE